MNAELILATLTAAERATVEGWLELLGFDAGDLEAVPPLLAVVEIVAVLRTSAAYGDLGEAETRLRAAAEDLGLEGDDGERTHSRYARKLRLWHARRKPFPGADSGPAVDSVQQPRRRIS